MRKTKRSRKRGGEGELLPYEKEILTQEYSGKKSPTIMELREFMKDKIDMKKLQEAIRFIVKLIGPLSPLSPLSPPPQSQSASNNINYNHPGFAQDMADHGR